ncbi:21645_t:CDS:1, partial [Dentiscutata erythropus]
MENNKIQSSLFEKNNSCETSSSPCNDPCEKLLVCNVFHEEPSSYTESNCPISNSDSRTSSLSSISNSSENDLFMHVSGTTRKSTSSNNDNSELPLDALMDNLFINTHKSILDLKNYVRKLESDLIKQDKKLKEQNESMKQFNKQTEIIEQLEKQNKGLKTQNEELKTQNKELIPQNKELKTQYKMLEMHNEELKKQNEELKTQNKELKKNNEELKKNREELGKNNEEIGKNYKELKKWNETQNEELKFNKL